MPSRSVPGRYHLLGRQVARKSRTMEFGHGPLMEARTPCDSSNELPQDRQATVDASPCKCRQVTTCGGGTGPRARVACSIGHTRTEPTILIFIEALKHKGLKILAVLALLGSPLSDL